MSAAATRVEVHYPESDGMPMAETDLHRRWMVWLIDALMSRYRDQRVYVSGDLFVYFVEGDTSQSVAPDAFVVLDCEPGDRRVFKTWEEQRVPNVVWEVTSKHTERVDTYKKRLQYEMIGVPEMFWYDPTSDYLPTPLMGFRLSGEDELRRHYVRMEPDAQGRLQCQELGLYLQLNRRNELTMTDAATGEPVLAAYEAEGLRAEAESRRAEAETRRADAAEAELARLRAQLRQRSGD